MTQEFPNQTSSPLWTSESVRLEKLAWRRSRGCGSRAGRS